MNLEVGMSILGEGEAAPTFSSFCLLGEASKHSNPEEEISIFLEGFTGELSLHLVFLGDSLYIRLLYLIIIFFLLKFLH